MATINHSSEAFLATNGTSSEEWYCAIGSFFLLLPIMICIIKDIMYDCQYYHQNAPMKRNRSEFRLQETSISSSERNNLLIENAGDILTHPHSPIHIPMSRAPPLLTETTIHLHPFELLLFNAFIIISYLTIRISASALGLRRDYKFYAGELQDIYEISLRSTVLFVFGGIYNRKPFLHFLLSCAWFTCLYTMVFEVSPEGFQLSSKMAMGGVLVLVCLAIVAIGIYVIGDNMFFAWSITKWRMYTFGLLVLAVVYHIGIALCGTEDVEIHLHHHHWAFVLCLFVQSPKTSSFAVQALLIGIFIHGICMFGDESLFQWSNTSPLNFGLDKCEKWECENYKCEIPKLL